MHRRASLAIAAVTAALLAAAAPASAKRVTAVSVCGASGCVDRTALLGPQRPDQGLLDLGGVSIAEPARAPFVRVKVHIGAGGQTFGASTLIVLPKQGLAAAQDGSWWQLPPRTLRGVRRLIGGIRPLPARKLVLPVPIDEAAASSARVDEVVAPPAARHAAIARGADGGTSPLVPAGIVAVLLGAGGAAVLTRRRRHAADALGETPATG